MAHVRGRSSVSRYIAQVPTKVVRLLGGAAKAGATIIADEAKARTQSAEVAGSIKVRVKSGPERVVAYIETRGKGAYLAPWEEYGTAPHLISVSDVDRGGMTVGRINQLNKQSLMIGGSFVGPTVQHPGARAHPFLRPSLDIRGADAVTAAQQFINTHVSRAGISVPADDGDQA